MQYIAYVMMFLFYSPKSAFTHLTTCMNTWNVFQVNTLAHDAVVAHTYGDDTSRVAAAVEHLTHISKRLVFKCLVHLR